MSSAPRWTVTLVARCRSTGSVLSLCVAILLAPLAGGAESNRQRKGQDPAIKESQLTYPPALPDGKQRVTDRSPRFLQPPADLALDASIAAEAPTVDFLFYPGQDHPGKPWSNWGDGCVANGKYYSAIGDHLAIGVKGDGSHGNGMAMVFEYDPATQTLRELVNTAKLLHLPQDHYAPSKIHSRLDMGSDGWLYFGTHRGSEKATTDDNHYRGDWILRTHPQTGQSEVVVQAPVPNHAIPTSVLDPQRLIFYGSTAAGSNSDQPGDRFFAYDIPHQKLLYSGPDGPARYMIFARSTGRVYYVPGRGDGPLMRFDAATDRTPTEVPGSLIGVRAATQETDDGFVYTVSLGQRSSDAAIWSFNTQTEQTRQIGTAAVGSQAYVASLDVDPSGRYLYYIPGAHGSSDRDGSPVVQFDVKTGQKKVLAFLHPLYQDKYDITLKGTYSTAVDPAGDKLYVTWNISRGGRSWDCCGLTVIHIPASERRP